MLSYFISFFIDVKAPSECRYIVRWGVCNKLVVLVAVYERNPNDVATQHETRVLFDIMIFDDAQYILVCLILD